MQFRSRRAVLGDAIDDWANRGLIPEATRGALNDDIARNDGQSWGFSGFVVVAGILCLGFAAITFVAANWDRIPRLARLGMILAAIVAAYAGAGWAMLNGRIWLRESLLLLASLAFGAGIMLVSQIYHIQGEPVQAVWLWALGALIAGALNRATLTLALAAALWITWHLLTIDDPFATSPASGVNFWFLLWWGLTATAALWSRARAAGHILILALIVWAGSEFLAVQNPVAAALIALTVCHALMAGLLLSAETGPWLRGFERAALGYMALAVLLLATVLYLAANPEFGNELAGPTGTWGIFGVSVALAIAVIAQLGRLQCAYDAWVAAGMAAAALVVFMLLPNPWLQAAFLLGLTIWITRMGWRTDIRPLRVLGMTGFALTMLLIYALTVGSLIGTSGFYLGAGIVLLAGGWIASRISAVKGETP